MVLIIGLGNPARKFQGTRHNLGFSVLDAFKKENQFSDWKRKKKLKAKISEGKVGRRKVVLAKPQTFMNNSGKATRLCTINYKLKTINLFVVHDDLDLPLGRMKISRGRRAAGHKGVQSIIDELGTRNFVRFRLGIATPVRSPVGSATSDRFVLQKFSKQERKIIKQIKKRASQALEIAIKQGVEKAMGEYN